MIRAALFLLGLLRPLFRLMGVDFDQLRAIVGIKLLLDTRRAGALTSLSQSSSTGSSVMAYIVYMLLGGLVGFLIAVVPSSIVAYALYHTFLMFFIAMILISDYSSVILDTSDNTIILPRPVSSKTLLVARITHIIIYIGQYAVCLTIIPLVITFVMRGWQAGIANVVASLLSSFLAFAATGGLYLLLIRFFKEDRLKSVINTFQIFTTIFLLTCFQVLPRLFDVADVKSMLSYLPWWALAVPPLWMSAFVTIFIDQPFTTLAAACIFLAIAIPFALVWLSSRYLAPFFASRLADLGTSTVATVPSHEPPRATWWERIAQSVTQPGPERASFQLVARYFSRDRKLKLRIYPSIGYFAVMGVITLLRTKEKSQTWGEFYDQLPETQGYVIMLYLAIFLVLGAAFEIFYSDEFKASWIFYSTPVDFPGKILMGASKAVIVQFFLPFYAFICVMVLFVWQLAAVPAVVVGLLMSIFVVFVISLASEKNLPISLQPSLRNHGGNLARGVIALVLIGLLGYGHFLLAKLGHWQWLSVPVLLLLIVLLAGRYAKTSWARIRQ